MYVSTLYSSVFEVQPCESLDIVVSTGYAEDGPRNTPFLDVRFRYAQQIMQDGDFKKCSFTKQEVASESKLRSAAILLFSNRSIKENFR